MWKSNNGAVAVIFGNPNYDYIYYNSSNFIGDLTVLNHEMGHVTDMWIWMENKRKTSGDVTERITRTDLRTRQTRL